MKISQGTAEARDVTVNFPGGAVLHVTYSPPAYTPAEIDRMAEEMLKPGASQGRRVAEQVCSLVLSWDLTENDGETLIPLDVDVVHQKVTTPILMAIVREVQKDQAVSPEA